MFSPSDMYKRGKLNKTKNNSSSCYVVLLQCINSFGDLGKDVIDRQLRVHLCVKTHVSEFTHEFLYLIYTRLIRHTHLPDNAPALVKSNDRLGSFVVQVQALLDGLFVIIRTAAGLAALQEPLDHGVGLRVDVQQQAGFANLGSKRVGRDFELCLQCGSEFVFKSVVLPSTLTFFSNSSPCFTSRG